MDENKEVPEYQNRMKFTDEELLLLYQALDDYSRRANGYQELIPQEKMRKLFDLTYKVRDCMIQSQNQQIVVQMRLEGKTYEEISRHIYLGDGGTQRIIEILHRRLNGDPEPHRD